MSTHIASDHARNHMQLTETKARSMARNNITLKILYAHLVLFNMLRVHGGVYRGNLRLSWCSKKSGNNWGVLHFICGFAAL